MFFLEMQIFFQVHNIALRGVVGSCWIDYDMAKLITSY